MHMQTTIDNYQQATVLYTCKQLVVRTFKFDLLSAGVTTGVRPPEGAADGLHTPAKNTGFLRGGTSTRKLHVHVHAD